MVIACRWSHQRVSLRSRYVHPHPTPRFQAMGPPYGVVGPESFNKKILVHDFTHRLHMDIFEQQYYPALLTDW